VTTEKFLTSLQGLRGWNPQLTQISEWVVEEQRHLLMEIAVALTDASCPASIQMGVRQSIVGSILRNLSLTSGAANAEMTLSVLLLEDRLWPPLRLGPPYKQRHPRAYLASILAFGQPQDALQSLFAGYGEDTRHRELLACLTQEMVLRGVMVEGTVAAAFFEQEVRIRQHPLGWLPLTLLHQEQKVVHYLPHYGPRGSSCSIPNWEEDVDSDVLEGDYAIHWTPCSVPASELERLKSATLNWQAASNGKIEAGVFYSDSILPATMLQSHAVQSLPMNCFLDAAPEKISVRAVSFDEVFSKLFAAASTGGAYNSGLYGAYGRLAAWHSASGFVGAEAGTPTEAVALATEHCAWLSFEAQSEWFYQVAWDLGLMALRPDGYTVAALTATDTD
jgi:hypothetical protein